MTLGGAGASIGLEMRFFRFGPLLSALWLFQGCVGPSAPVAVRDPAYRPQEIRRPAVLLQVALDQSGFGEGEFTSQERASFPEELETGLIDSLNGQGIFPLDVSLSALPAYRGASAPIDRLDRAPALARARSLQADVLLVMDMHLSRRTLSFCRGTARPFSALTTVVAITLEVLRVTDGRRLLLEPPDANLTVTDVDAPCTKEGRARRLSPQELTDAAVSRLLTRLMRR